MTYEEAREILNNTAWLGTDNGIRVYKAVKMAIVAIEKQIPMVVKGEYPFYCPRCGHKLAPEIFCSDCGQRLEYREVTNDE